MTEMDALKPCPFCGGEATLNHGATGDFDVSCRNRKCFGPRTSSYVFMSDAIAAWNRRPSLSPAVVTEEQVAALTKTFCGDKLNGGVLRDMAFTVWQKCQKPTHEDGNTDWFNDTLPVVDAAVEQLRAALEAAAKVRSPADAKGDA